MMATYGDLDSATFDDDRECPKCGERMCDGIRFNARISGGFDDIRVCRRCRPDEHETQCIEEHDFE